MTSRLSQLEPRSVTTDLSAEWRVTDNSDVNGHLLLQGRRSLAAMPFVRRFGEAPAAVADRSGVGDPADAAQDGVPGQPLAACDVRGSTAANQRIVVVDRRRRGGRSQEVTRPLRHQ